MEKIEVGLDQLERTKMHVTLVAAMTIDGFIARTEHDRSFDWTSPEDKQFYISKLKECDAVIMGSKTFRTFTRYPKGMHYVILTRKPEEFDNPRPEVISLEATNQGPEEIVEKLRQEGRKKVMVAGGSSVYRQFLAANVVDSLFITVEPVLFGAGVSLFDGAVAEANDPQGFKQLQLKDVHHLSDQTIVLEYAT